MLERQAISTFLALSYRSALLCRQQELRTSDMPRETSLCNHLDRVKSENYCAVFNSLRGNVNAFARAALITHVYSAHIWYDCSHARVVGLSKSSKMASLV